MLVELGLIWMSFSLLTLFSVKQRRRPFDFCLQVPPMATHVLKTRPFRAFFFEVSKSCRLLTSLPFSHDLRRVFEEPGLHGARVRWAVRPRLALVALREAKSGAAAARGVQAQHFATRGRGATDGQPGAGRRAGGGGPASVFV